MPEIVPCLWFDTQAEEAAEFYVSVFPNSKVTSVDRYGEAGPRPAGTVLTAAFELDGKPFLALNGGPEFTFDEAVSMQVFCADQQEVDHYWASLTADGGQESQCGWLKDRFRFSWQIVPTRLTELLHDPDPARAQRAMSAMLRMRKIVIAEIEDAADGG
ncbi:VOC family protein [Sinomonas terrae]|uniref:VOC family protein n=1 Tax=Sinomonas terrae TaxID=2908838 RepID=A0ABS9U0V8_9MICC|nr:VOC family protein [Sinomonas terrae]MCH6470343.1 VOC family protein [Sinomonas terrae]